MIQRLLFSNFRFVYKSSRLLRSRFTSSGLLVLTAAIMAGIFGFDTRQTLSFQIFSLLSSVLLLAAACSLFFRAHLSVRRYLPEFATAGQTLTYELLVQNHGDSAQVDINAIDELETTLPSFDEFKKSHDPLDQKRNRFDRYIGYPRLMNLIRRRRGGLIQPGENFSIAGHGQFRTTNTLVPVTRGYLRFDNVRILKSDPFGLVNSIKKFRLQDKLLVFPRYIYLGKFALPGSRKYQPQGRTMSNTVGESEEFLSLREYRAGDPLKKIHWKSFARMNEPVIKEYHDEYCVRQGLILDTWNNTGNDSLFEDAVSAATSFAMSCVQQDSILDLMFVGDKSYRFNAGRGSLALENMLEILACVRSSDKNNLQTLQQFTIRYLGECSVYICILMEWDEPRKNLIRTLRQHGITVLCVVITGEDDPGEPDLEPMLGTPEYLHLVRQSRFDRDLANISSRLKHE